MKETITSKEEFYKRIRPALNIKVKDIKRDYNVEITVQEMFDYLEKMVWILKKNLTLIEVVDDIFEINVDKLFEHVGKRRQYEKII